MVRPLLETKLEIPARRRGLIARPRLHRKLSADPQAALTLICAPAGFGKTTLLTEWLTDDAGDRPAVAWLSLDERDNDPSAFWAYVIASVNASKPHTVSPESLSLLEAPQPALDAVVTAVVNDLHHLPNDLVVVLDDYHLIEALEVQESVALFLGHLPRHVRLVITSRVDPNLPLALLRARGQLVEVRAEDLRFTSDETTSYLTGAMGLQLSDHDVASLDERTEGWIAALQLAALSIQGRADPTAFIEGFAGDDRYIVDFLTQEVLQRQAPDVRAFLLKTSILERLNASVCDALTGQDDSRATLAALEHANLFVVPLDAQRIWYRYHSLFADVLHAHLLEEHAGEVVELHQRASDWFEAAGDLAEAIRHAVSAQNFERAATLMERAMPVMRRDRQEATIRDWLRALPGELLPRRPVLSVGFAGALAATGEFDGIDALLQSAEWWLDAARAAPAPGSTASEIVVVDDDEFVRLPATVQMLRAGRSLAAGDLDTTVEHAQQAISLSPSGDSLPRAGATALVGLASWARGDLDTGYHAYAECKAVLQRLGHHSDALGCTLALADIRFAQGRLTDAMRTCEQGLEVVDARGGGAVRGTADMHTALAYLHGERGDLDAARQHLQRSQELGEHLGLPQHRYRWRVAKARVVQAEGDFDTAMLLLDEAERFYNGDFSPNVRPVAAVKARLRLRRGELAHVRTWAEQHELSADDELSYVREFEHVTLARLLLAEFAATGESGALAAAEALLARLLTAAEQGQRLGTVIELLTLQAIAHHLEGDTSGALHSLGTAVGSAETECYVSVFTDEAATLTPLLKALTKSGGGPAVFSAHLLAAANPPHGVEKLTQPLVDPLSDRELEVLRLLSSELDGPEIARHLVVSVNTVRTHTKHIYAKLGVNNRRAAVSRGRQLNLL